MSIAFVSAYVLYPAFGSNWDHSNQWYQSTNHVRSAVSANEMQFTVMFQWLTNGLVDLPFVLMVPMDKSLPQGSQVLMICSLHLVHQSVKQLTIRTNGTNRKACLTIVTSCQW